MRCCASGRRASVVCVPLFVLSKCVVVCLWGGQRCVFLKWRVVCVVGVLSCVCLCVWACSVWLWLCLCWCACSDGCVALEWWELCDALWMFVGVCAMRGSTNACVVCVVLRVILCVFCGALCCDSFARCAIALCARSDSCGVPQCSFAERSARCCVACPSVLHRWVGRCGGLLLGVTWRSSTL